MRGPGFWFLLPHPRSGGQGLRQFLEPGPQVSQPLGDVHGGEAFHLADVFQFVDEVDYRPVAQGPQPVLVAGGRWANLDITVAKVPSSSRRGPILAGWVRRASRAESLPKSWHPSQ